VEVSAAAGDLKSDCVRGAAGLAFLVVERARGAGAAPGMGRTEGQAPLGEGESREAALG
jgi:hypothetical protein